MNISTDKQASSFLFRLRSQDTPNGVSDETFTQLIQATGLSKTDVLHLALRKLADEFLPAYEAEDADFTDAQIQYLRDNSPAKNIPEERFMKLY
ncbi:hypothetical protein V6M93_01230 [Pectobacterium brasiliense]|jgi:hypothetical protein|uniref:hypothetical protein n=1 Tax=Enterobacterales TaxID=91347 RepID=UPI000577F9F8|nr:MULTISPECIES: hypothetical protein [Pectobacteriaceae]EKN6387900.1 hypothetical protein [Yersinia enterocolitica]WGL29751.1 hypothetical protein OWC53_09510 [Pectobacterium brasiliense]BEH73288.1 hypothetical protein GBS0709_24050 [Edwardsiella tarda]